MPTCIYCRALTTGKEGVPHVIPEALGQNNLTLPKGAECDKCNQYRSVGETSPSFVHLARVAASLVHG